MKKRHSNRKNLLIILTILLTILILGAFLYFRSDETSSTSVAPKTNVLDKESVKQDFQDASFEENGKWYGLCKKNSIHSIADFQRTVSNDPLLKAHFTGFKWENAQMGQLEKATWAYVYYRKNETIFRKKTQILLPAGDGYITDGNSKVRTQCCNSYVTENPELDADPSAGLPMQIEPIDPIQDTLPTKTFAQYSFKQNPETRALMNDYPMINLCAGPGPCHHSDPLPRPCPPCPCDGKASEPASNPGTDPASGGTISTPAPGKADPALKSKMALFSQYCYCPDTCPDFPKPPPKPPRQVPEPSTIVLLGIGILCFLCLCFIFRKTGLHRG